jgi:hypothetical protein
VFTVVALGCACALAVSSAAVANLPTKTVSQDPYTNSTSYHKTEVEHDTFSAGSTIVSVFQAGRFTDGGASNIMYATSNNAGGSWRSAGLPGTTTFANPPGQYRRITDPAIAFDAKHHEWIAITLASKATSGFTGNGVLASRSSNGVHWANPVAVATTTTGSFDSTWGVCDNTPTSPHYGNCYAEWDDFGLGAVFEMAFSSDGGLTWTMSSTPSSTVIGGKPLVQPNGNVVVPIDSNPIAQTESFVSRDGGLTFQGPFVIDTIQQHTPAGNVRSLDTVGADVDATGRVYVTWYDCRFRPGCSVNDIVMSSSTNGRTWTAPVRIPIDPTSSTVDHFLAGISVEPGTGGSSADLAVTYWDITNGTTCGSNDCQLNYGFIESSDAGATWGTATQIVGPFTLTWLPLTTSGYMVGDYSSSSWVGSSFQTVFAIARASTCTVGANDCLVASASARLVASAGPSRPAGTRVRSHAGSSGAHEGLARTA